MNTKNIIETIKKVSTEINKTEISAVEIDINPLELLKKTFDNMEKNLKELQDISSDVEKVSKACNNLQENLATLNCFNVKFEKLDGLIVVESFDIVQAGVKYHCMREVFSEVDNEYICTKHESITNICTC